MFSTRVQRRSAPCPGVLNNYILSKKRTAEKGVKDLLEMLLRGDCARARVVACDSREAAGKKIGGIDPVLGRVAGEVILAVDERTVKTVLQQIENIIADEEDDHVPPLRNVLAVGAANVLQSHGGAAALVVLRAEAIFSLENEGDDVVLGGEERVEGLAGDAGALADFAHADAGIRLILH